ncbi:hypothetical protein BTH42_33455 [Burkholderia sp. SRS-W-2-2016]|uniref:O-antigen ligase family protein n=1 Tax=Burkholderia sp. SRS-W-2-2016 TaxID=1926878 RepID=UPI00094B46E3|nr:O-antigen ligase family protein [Burkholderia sp. SRS-W-2-2016]OLL27321.1 hypothetical protein BTH42_33455 [Burkholderia sp. SRS-W-2-2016]
MNISREKFMLFGALASGALYSAQVIDEIPAQLLLAIVPLACGVMALPRVFGKSASFAITLRNSRGLIALFGLLGAYLFVHMIAKADLKTLERLVQVLIAFLCMVGGATLEPVTRTVRGGREQDMKKIIVCAVSLAIVIALTIVVAVSSGDAKNKHAYSLFFCLTLAWAVIRRKKLDSDNAGIAVLSFLAIVVGLATDTRGLAVYALFCVGIAMLCKLPLIGRFAARYVFIPIVVFLAVYVIYYEAIATFGDRLLWSAFHYTGRTALSGRQDIWPAYIQAFYKDPIFGVGPSAIPDVENTHGYRVSAHNFYLQYATEFGLVGLAIVILIMRSIWRTVSLSRTRNPLALSVVLMVVMANSTEALLLENMFYVGICQWILIGMALAAARRSYLCAQPVEDDAACATGPAIGLAGLRPSTGESL